MAIYDRISAPFPSHEEIYTKPSHLFLTEGKSNAIELPLESIRPSEGYEEVQEENLDNDYSTIEEKRQVTIATVRRSSIQLGDLTVTLFKIYRIFAIICIFLFLIIIIGAIANYEINLSEIEEEINNNKNKSKSNFLLCFDFTGDLYFPFQTDIYALYLYLLFLFVTLICTIYMLIESDIPSLKNYLYRSLLFILLTLAVLGASFIIGAVFKERNFKFMITNLLLSISGFTFTGYIYFKTRKSIYYDIKIFLGEYFLTSLLFSFECYFVLFNICDLVTKNNQSANKGKAQDRENEIMNFLCNIAYFLSGIIVLTIFRDIVFPIILIIIELGLLMTPKGDAKDVITAVVTVLFVFYALVFTIFKSKKELFRIYQEKDNTDLKEPIAEDKIEEEMVNKDDNDII